MYEETKYRTISYILTIFLTFGIIFGVSSVNETFELIFDLLYLVWALTLFLWLKKKIILTGLLIYFLSFNYRLLFSPLIPGSPILTLEPYSFLLKLEFLAFFLMMAGLADAYFGDKYLNYNSRLNMVPILTFLIVGTVIIQIVVRNYG